MSLFSYITCYFFLHFVCSLILFGYARLSNKYQWFKSSVSGHVLAFPFWTKKVVKELCWWSILAPLIVGFWAASLLIWYLMVLIGTILKRFFLAFKYIIVSVGGVSLANGISRLFYELMGVEQPVAPPQIEDKKEAVASYRTPAPIECSCRCHEPGITGTITVPAITGITGTPGITILSIPPVVGTITPNQLDYINANISR